MVFGGFTDDTFALLGELSRSDEPTALAAHHDAYERFVLEPAKALVEALGPRLELLDPNLRAVPRVRASIKSVERRRRFPWSKEPRFKDSLDLWFWSGTRRSWDNSGFFVRMTPARLVLAAGMIEFQKEALASYREHLLDDVRGAELASIVEALRAGGYSVNGAGYQRTPQGVPADHPRAALAKHRGLFATRDTEHPPEIRTAAFPEILMEHFTRMAPLHAWLVAGPAAPTRRGPR